MSEVLGGNSYEDGYSWASNMSDEQLAVYQNYLSGAGEYETLRIEDLSEEELERIERGLLPARGEVEQELSAPPAVKMEQNRLINELEALYNLPDAEKPRTD